MVSFQLSLSTDLIDLSAHSRFEPAQVFGTHNSSLLLLLILAMFSVRFPLPIDNLLPPPKFFFGCAFPKPYVSDRRRFSNLRLRAADVAAPTAEEAALPAGLQKEFLPRHVAVIMDGNVRWARRMKLPDSKGHDAGVRSLREMVDLCLELDIPVLTVFAFSYDNWLRSKVRFPF